MKQQPANYGRLRECLSMCPQFVVSTHMHGCALWPKHLSLSSSLPIIWVLIAEKPWFVLFFDGRYRLYFLTIFTCLVGLVSL